MTTRDSRHFNAYQQARYDWILKVAENIHGKKVLDVGCGFILQYFAKRLLLTFKYESSNNVDSS